MIARLIFPLSGRDALIGVLLCTVLPPPTLAQAPLPGTQFDNSASKNVVADAMLEASQRFKVPVVWLRAVMRAESDGNTKSVSKKGAMGLMQVMPKTYEELRAKYGLGPDPIDPHDNVLAGAAYLAELFSRFGSKGFLAAYNAGPRRYEEHLLGRPLPSETADYVARLAPRLGIAGPPLALTTARIHALGAPIFLAAFAPKTPDKAATERDVDGAARSKKAAPHPLFPAQTSDKIFADRALSGHASNHPKVAASLQSSDLFVAPSTSERSQ
jgi:hypothetical protein